MVAPLKPGWTVEDVYERAEKTLHECLVNGTTRMRTQVEIDPGIGLRGFEAIRSLADDYRWAIDIELCVFPQDGLTNYPGTEELLVTALKQGAPVLGAAPRYDSDPSAQIDRIFALAREYDVDLDLHLDVGDNPAHMDVYRVLELTEQYKRGGRVVVGHMAKLSLLPPTELAALAGRLRDAGIAVTVLPATDLYLMGRERDHAVVRGVADANFLSASGLTCSLSSNNILNAATPVWRLLADPHRQSAGECAADRRAGRVARVVPDADRALGKAAQSEGLRARARQSRGPRRHRRGDAGAGGRGDPPAPRGMEARTPDRDPPPAGIAAPLSVRA